MKKLGIILLCLVVLLPYLMAAWDSSLPADSSAWNDAAGFIRDNWDALENGTAIGWYEVTNIKQYLPDGYVTDGSVDYSTQIQEAIDADPAILFIPEGTFACNVEIDGKVNVYGTGPHSELLAYTTDPVITVTGRISGNDGGRRFQNFTIKGNGDTAKGIYYSVLNVEEEIIAVIFEDCTRGIDFGTAGSIGNTVRYCSFIGCQYGVYANDTVTIALNLNMFTENRFRAIDLCCIYMDGSDVGCAGNSFINNWFEGCDGFGIILKGKMVRGQPNVLALGWFESIAADGDTVTLDDEGAGQVVRTVWLDTTTMNSQNFPGNALVNDSVLNIDNFRGDRGAAAYNEMTITGTSRVIIDTAMFDDNASNEMIAAPTASFVVEKPRVYREDSTNRGFLVEGLPMVNNVTDYTNATPVALLATYSGSTLTWQDESLYGSPVRRFALSDDTERLRISAPTSDGKVYALTFSIRSSTGTAEEDIRCIVIGGGTALNNKEIIARGDRWTHYVGIVTAGDTAPTDAYLNIYPTSGNAATFDISRLQFVECDTLPEAEAYIHAQNFAVAATRLYTLANNGTPPVVSDEAHSYWATGGTTTITDLDDGYTGQVITILAAHTITIDDQTNIILDADGDWQMDSGDALTLIQKSDTYWYEISRADTQ